jgi:NADH-quinone oxidoreductase subunit L
MPFTYAAFLAGALALAGIPPFAGFFSKDPILASALDAGTLGYILFGLAAFGAFLTGLYTFRMVFIAFGGEPTAELRERHHRHGGREGPLTMLVVVGTLALLATFAGWLQFVPFWEPVNDFLNPVAEPLVEPTNTMELVASVVGVSVGLVGIFVAWLLYSAKRFGPPKPWETLQEKFYFDELYDAIFYRPAVATTKLLYALVEGPLIGGSLIGISGGTGRLATWVRTLQTGIVRSYVLAVTAGLAVLALVFISVR